MSFTKHETSFDSEGIGCAGWLFVPDSADRPCPGVVMAHGIGAVKENDIEVYAERFAAAGLVTLVFDYRHLGASGGQPRQQILVHDQQEDYRNALTWLGRHPLVDAQRLGIWGTSFAGGHVLQIAAHDRRVKAVVSQVPMVDVWQTLQRMSTPQALGALLAMLRADRERRFGSPDRATLPLVAPLGQPSALGSAEYERHMRWEATTPWRNEITVESIERMLEYNPSAYAARVSPTPLLMIVASGDQLTPPDLSLAAYEAALEPKRLVLLPGPHYAVYEEPRSIGVAADAAVDWFAQHLSTTSGAALSGADAG